jgi:hypothetical protein
MGMHFFIKGTFIRLISLEHVVTIIVYTHVLCMTRAHTTSKESKKEDEDRKSKTHRHKA